MPLSTFLNGRPYTQLRGAAWLAFSDTGHILSGSVTDDGGGGGTTVWTAGTSIPCRIDPLSRQEELVGERISDRSTHVVHIGPGLSVSTGDRFSIDNRGTFEITAVRDRTGELAGVFEVVLT